MKCVLFLPSLLFFFLLSAFQSPFASSSSPWEPINQRDISSTLYFFFSPDFLDEMKAAQVFGGVPFFGRIPMHAMAFPRFLSELGKKRFTYGNTFPHSSVVVVLLLLLLLGLLVALEGTLAGHDEAVEERRQPKGHHDYPENLFK